MNDHSLNAFTNNSDYDVTEKLNFDHLDIKCLQYHLFTNQMSAKLCVIKS